MEQNLNFRQWMELFAAPGANPTNQTANDPALMAIQNQATQAMQKAVKSGGDPVAAAQDVITKSKLTPEQMAKILPKKQGANPGQPNMPGQANSNNMVK